VATVTGVTVSPATATVAKGGTQTFTAAVAGENSPAQTVTWSVEGAASVSGTAINEGGVLSVAAGETATTLTVRAESTVDTTKFDTAAVTVSSGPPPDLDVYMAGYTTRDNLRVPCYWVNGNMTLLSLPSTGTFGEANGIAVSGSGDVYTAGYIFVPGTNGEVPCYWKNSVRMDIPGVGGGEATGIAVSDSDDVYIVGIRYGVSGDGFWYLENNTAYGSPAPTGKGSYATGIAVSGGAVYISGCDVQIDTGDTTVWYLRNGSTELSSAIGTEGYVTGIAVSDSGDVYISGHGLVGGERVPGYWKSSEPYPAALPIPSPGIGASAEAIAVSGSDVYILGFSYENIYYPTPCFWINGELASSPFPDIDGEVLGFTLVSSTD
jgi:hypothetical protein